MNPDQTPQPTAPSMETPSKPINTPGMLPGEKLIKQGAGGKFIKGTCPGPGRKPNGQDRFSKLMKEQVMEWIETQGSQANPLMIAARMAVQFQHTEPMIALRAGDMVCKYTMPRLTEITGKDGGAIRFADRERDVSELARDPKIRAIIESAEEHLGHED